MKCLYTYRSQYTGLVFRVEASDVETVTDEPYPPGGMLRVMRGKSGGIIGGPLVSELLTWEVSP